MSTCRRLTAVGAGIVTLALIVAKRASIQRMVRGLACLRARGVEDPPRLAVAPRDAGWVRVLDPDATTVRGRGQLLVWREPATAEGAARIEGRIDSFTSTAGALAPGDAVLLFPELGGEQIRVTVLGVSPTDHHSVLDLEWGDEPLPVSLRELVGH